MRRHDDNIGRRISDFQHDTRFFHFPRCRRIEISHVNRWWWRRRRHWQSRYRQHRATIPTVSAVFVIIDYSAGRCDVDGVRNAIATWISAWQVRGVRWLHRCIHWVWQHCRRIDGCIIAESWESICIGRGLWSRWPRWRRGRRVFTADSAGIEWFTGNDNACTVYYIVTKQVNGEKAGGGHCQWLYELCNSHNLRKLLINMHCSRRESSFIIGKWGKMLGLTEFDTPYHIGRPLSSHIAHHYC